jgi:hypothetical protein
MIPGAFGSEITKIPPINEVLRRYRRLHIRYKTATWLRGLIPNPFMRSPMPKPRQEEIDTLYGLLKDLRFDVIEARETRLAAQRPAERLATMAVFHSARPAAGRNGA